MSNYSIEALADVLVERITALPLPDEEKIRCIHPVYEWAEDFDAGFIKLRQFDALLACGYFRLFPLREHPQYGQYKGIFDQAAKKDFLFLYEKPDQKWHATNNPTGCYWIGKVYGRQELVGMLCCDPGHTLWAALAGKTPPEKRDEMLPLFLRLGELAERQGDNTLKAALYYAMVYVLSNPFAEAHLPAVSHLQELLQREPVVEALGNELEYTGWVEDTLDICEDVPEDEYPLFHEWLKALRDWAAKRRPAKKSAATETKTAKNEAKPAETSAAPDRALEEAFQEWDQALRNHPNDLKMRHQYAEQLTKQITRKDTALSRPFLEKLKELYDRYSDDPEIAYRMAYGMVDTVRMLPFEKGVRMVEQMGLLAHLHPDNLKVLIEYAEGLWQLTQRAAEEEKQPEMAEECARLADELSQSYPEVPKIQDWCARSQDRILTAMDERSTEHPAFARLEALAARQQDDERVFDTYSYWLYRLMDDKAGADKRLDGVYGEGKHVVYWQS